MIVVIDYRMGNVGSIRNMLRKVGAEAKVSADPEEIAAADRLILPGVGAFDTGMRRIEELGLRPVLEQKVVRDGTPVLGICLGMQLLMERSEEGSLPGLGWIPGSVVRFDRQAVDGLKVPHMGWNVARPVRQDPLFRELDELPRFYFVHGFHVRCEEPGDGIAITNYGYDFVSAVRRGPIAGTQFHPEKSHRYGLRLLRNFAAGA